ncbi:hypothetical protein Ping_3055 [Psychromonas ingrahamii 37]|uniref:Uncharacterized protein n=1 Tax=Psychromonas ingrahamii (strain DSM 17664 / CCUG 51855 / 37) TaxID=357804 RepID=A1SZ40_PSYIN|nr:hypothetical protein [Psychromonas ingrahamii]ABM04755.1 hypothetical protein Ping_3055 [Psychromonas ingrahamii 37]
MLPVGALFKALLFYQFIVAVELNVYLKGIGKISGIFNGVHAGFSRSTLTLTGFFPELIRVFSYVTSWSRFMSILVRVTINATKLLAEQTARNSPINALAYFFILTVLLPFISFYVFCQKKQKKWPSKEDHT